MFLKNPPLHDSMIRIIGEVVVVVVVVVEGRNLLFDIAPPSFSLFRSLLESREVENYSEFHPSSNLIFVLWS